MKTLLYSSIWLLLSIDVFAQNIDPFNDGSKYAYGENIGWLNFKPALGGGVTVTDTAMIGFVWCENTGWLNLAPVYGGVANNGLGELSGFAWGENIGWLNFNPNSPGEVNDEYRVRINHDGDFEGWAWGENIGWVHFAADSPVIFKVSTSWLTSCRVDLNDLAAFAQEWLLVSPLRTRLDSDFIVSGRISYVDMTDFAHLSSLWMDRCPWAWPWLD
ncbi:MAG: hypothetical protein LLF76_10345 [Planctomycetaceae bacterium]|nr:hypothetical protein [Planctomycetaceae bacterium]